MGDSGSNGVTTLEVSVSFGRFEKDSSLCWEKWSAFPTNKYLEEVEKCSTPGSVAQKAAYFEAHYKKIAARKIEQIQDEEKKNKWDEENDGREEEEVLKEQDRAAEQRLVEEKFEGLRVDRLGVVGYEKNHVPGDATSDLTSEVDGSQMVEPKDNVDDLLVHKVDSAAPAQPIADPEVELYCRDQSTTEMHESELAVIVEEKLINSTSEVVDSPMDVEPSIDLIIAEHIEDLPPQVEEAKDESRCITTVKDGLPESDEVILGPTKEEACAPSGTSDKEEVRAPSGTSDKEEARDIESQDSVRSPMSVIDKAREDIPKDASAQKAKFGKSTGSQKITPGKARTTSSASVKKTPASSRPKSPLISSNPKSSKPALSRSVMSESKAPPALSRSAMSESKAPAALSRSVMMSESKAMPKKENGVSMPSKKSTATRVESKRTPVPTSLHTSLNLDAANSGSAPGGAVRKSLIMERMGDKDIVKRAFKAFQKNFNQLSSSAVEKPILTSQILQGSEKDKKPKGPAVGTPSKKSDGLIKSVKKASPRVGQPGLRKASVMPGSPSTLHSDQRSARPVSFSSPYNLRSNDKPNRQKEVAQKLDNRSISKAVEKPRLLHKAKVVEKKETTESKKLPVERNHHIRTKPVTSSVASKSSIQKRDGKA